MDFSLTIVSKLKCEDCELSKHSMFSYLPRVNTHSHSLSSLVQSNIWILRFIDDFSRLFGYLFWKNDLTFLLKFSLFLMKYRLSLVFLCKHFIDNALEFFSSTITLVCYNNGLFMNLLMFINHNKMVLLHKNQYLLDITRTSSFQM